jgi:CBS domain-containing protein
MTVTELYSTPPITAHPNETIVQASRRMRDKHVGDLVVVDDTKRVVGILTDRDIVVSAVAQSHDRLDSLRVGDVMTTEVVSARHDDTVEAALKTMAARGVRRLPVLGAGGQLDGILSLDDLLQRESLQLWNLVTIVAREQRQERELRR